MLRVLPALLFVSIASLAGLSLTLTASTTAPTAPEDTLIQDATLVFSRAVQTPAAAIPAGVLMRAAGIVVIPAATRDGVRYHGKGVMSARGARPDMWTPPAVISVEGELPLNLEADTVDFVLVAQSRRALNCLTEARYAGAHAMAAGPLGHNTMPGTNADFLAYVHFDNYFAGVAIDRWELREVTASNAALYGRPYSTYDIVRGAGFFHLPTAARLWRATLVAYFREMT